MKKLVILMALIAVLSIATALALEPGQASISTTDLGEYVNATADTLDATGGTIFDVDVSATTGTIRWSGISGTVTGNIVLGDNTGTIMYDWGSATPIAVYATLNTDAINWDSGLVAGNEVNFLTDFPYLTAANAPNDNYNTTFTGTLSMDTDVNSNMFTPTCPSVLTDDNSAAYWPTLHCEDATGQPVMVGEVDSAVHANYAGVNVNYQMIVPELGGQGNEAATSWDLWVELE
ncbi:hypothetical protein JXA48_01975 [Candidatus Woesearchaeota archaeon]|nr:hypothetical protein [Candidatus Woesearchaeota archaeon]